ncbi:MAG: LCP family protein [bacterium]|nr:LCP family protein [bacterium]
MDRRDFIKIFSLAAGGFVVGGWPGVEPGNPTPEKKINLFYKLISPFLNTAEPQRVARAENDHEFAQRIDSELNNGRVNFLLFSWGETYEPPFKYVGIIGSQTIFSYDNKKQAVDLVSITHDVRAPEIENFHKVQGRTNVGPIKIDQAYKTGGFPLMQQVLERATGLSVDFQMAFSDDIIVEGIEKCFGKIKVEVPKTFQVNPFYFRGKQYEAAEFQEGTQELTGLQAIQFIKTVPIEQGKTDRALEHNARKALIFAGLLQEMKEKSFDPRFWLNLKDFLEKATAEKRLALDFNMQDLLLGNLASVGDLFGNALKAKLFGEDLSFMPQINKNVYIVDRSQGDGGVSWVKGSQNPLTQQEYASGFYTDPNMEIPGGGNPYAEDLINDYWKTIREKVKELLTPPPSEDNQNNQVILQSP